MTDMQPRSSGKTIEPKSINKPVKANRSTGYSMGTRVDGSERTARRGKSRTTGKSFKKVNGIRSGVMLPPTGKQ